MPLATATNPVTMKTEWACLISGDNNCRNGFYWDYTLFACTECVEFCDMCDEKDTCDSCSEGYIFNEEQKACVLDTPFNCFTMNTDGTCKTCALAYSIDSEGKCSIDCELGVGGICDACMINEDDEIECIACPVNSYLGEDGHCVIDNCEIYSRNGEKVFCDDCGSGFGNVPVQDSPNTLGYNGFFGGWCMDCNDSLCDECKIVATLDTGKITGFKIDN